MFLTAGFYMLTQIQKKIIYLRYQGSLIKKPTSTYENKEKEKIYVSRGHETHIAIWQTKKIVMI